jgi:hypothetical protein
MRAWGLLFSVAVAAVIGVTAAVAAGAPVGRPIATAVDIDSDAGAASETMYARLRATGAGWVRISLKWSAVAPEQKPALFDAANPDDPAYRWDAAPDRAIAAAVAHGFQPYVTIDAAPTWAQASPAGSGDASNRPDAAAFAAFAGAVATRYGGGFQSLPRVRYFQAWNEPNLSINLFPQLEGGRPVAPGVYRSMLNAFADAVHRVHSDNVVVAGGLAPFAQFRLSPVAQYPDWGPLAFMRALLCLSPSLKPTCSTPAKFDVWAQHPYTSGDPQHHAVATNDVSLADLPEVRKVLSAAEAAGHIVSRGRPGFWVTEFSWDSNPPDPGGVPVALETRWVAEAVYRMWQNSVTLVTWLMLTDAPLATSYYQSGLYYIDGRPKPVLRAFRFPFVAYRDGGGISFWGRTPRGAAAAVIVEEKLRRGWTSAGTMRSDRYGIFSGRLPAAPAGFLRARLVSGGERSQPFSLVRPPDRRVNPFGRPTLGP